jgi:hypothetical protein
VQPQVGPSLGPSDRPPGRAEREPGPIARRQAKRLHFVMRCLASGTRRLGRIHQSISRFQTAHLIPAAHFLRPGLCTFASLTRIEGWAERRETFGCCAEHPLGLHVTRQARRLRGALRPMTRDARLSALHRGGFGPRGRASVSFGARRPTTAGSCLPDPCSELLAARS